MEPALTSIAQCPWGVSLAPGLDEFDRRGAEVLGWHEIHSLVDYLTAEGLLKPGYYSAGWTVRDLIRAGGYHAGALNVEAANGRFSELTKGIPFEVVYVQAWVSRWRMLGVWQDLTEITRPAVGWLDKAGTTLRRASSSSPGLGRRAGRPSHRGEMRI